MSVHVYILLNVNAPTIYMTSQVQHFVCACCTAGGSVNCRTNAGHMNEG